MGSVHETCGILILNNMCFVSLLREQMCSQTCQGRVEVRSRDSHRDRLSPCTLAFGCRSPRTAAHRTQEEGCCTAVSWTVFLYRRSHCTGSTAATSPSYQPLDGQRSVSYTITVMLEKGTSVPYGSSHLDTA